MDFYCLEGKVNQCVDGPKSALYRYPACSPELVTVLLAGWCILIEFPLGVPTYIVLIVIDKLARSRKLCSDTLLVPVKST